MYVYVEKHITGSSVRCSTEHCMRETCFCVTRDEQALSEVNKHAQGVCFFFLLQTLHATLPRKMHCIRYSSVFFGGLAVYFEVLVLALVTCELC